MSAVHKLCSMKLNSDKMPSQIYNNCRSIIDQLSSVILYIVYLSKFAEKVAAKVSLKHRHR